MKNTLAGGIRSGLEKVVFSKTASIISGIVCAIPFVFCKAFPLSYVMYVPLFYLFFMSQKLKETGKRLYNRVFLFGFFFYVVGYIWLCELYPLDFAGFTKTEALGVVVLALTAIPAIHSALFTACFAFCHVCTRGAGAAVKTAAFPCIVVFNEFLQTLGPLAFPWCRVSIAQSEFLPSLQSASLLGSYFITYIVLLINAFIGYALINPKFTKRMLACAAAVFTVNTAFGAARMALYNRNTEHFTAIALQGNLSSDAKWSGSVSDMLNLYIELADNALAEAKEKKQAENTVILMPETALPVILTKDSVFSQRISDYADKNNVIFAAGGFSAVEESSANSVFIFDSEGRMSEPYMKRTLVPFGEYMPYRELLCTIAPALADINMLSSDLYAGTDTVVFETDVANIGAAICFESVFPSLCRDTVNDGANILLIATNDSWFGASVALRHHLAAAQLRAIENNVPVIRAANTGISALINPDGSCEARLGANIRGSITAELYMGSGKTLYGYVGDVFLWICLAVTLLEPFRRLVFRMFVRY